MPLDSGGLTQYFENTSLADLKLFAAELINGLAHDKANYPPSTTSRKNRKSTLLTGEEGRQTYALFHNLFHHKDWKALGKAEMKAYFDAVSPLRQLRFNGPDGVETPASIFLNASTHFFSKAKNRVQMAPPLIQNQGEFSHELHPSIQRILDDLGNTDIKDDHHRPTEPAQG